MSEELDPNAADAAQTPPVEATPSADDGAPAAAAPAVEPAAKAEEGRKPLAAGAPEPAPAQEGKPYWGEEWRQKMAEHASAGDKKAYERELKRLERFSDPAAVYGMYRELESKFSEGGLVKIPGKDAKEDEIKAFQKAIGVPEDPKAYVDNLELPDGVQLGDLDKNIASDFAGDMHAAGLTQAQMNKAMSWYYKTEEARAANIDQQDDTNKLDGTKQLKDEWGPAFQRNINAIPTLFSYAPGGADQNNPSSLFNRLLAGRLADGKIIGDDPDMLKFMVSLAREVNPTATVVDNDGSGRGVDDEIAEIEKLMRSDRRAYDKDTQKQARYRELLGARERHRARSAA